MPDYAPGLVDGWWNGGCCFQKGHISFSASLVAAAEATLALSELEAGQMQPAHCGCHSQKHTSRNSKSSIRKALSQLGAPPHAAYVRLFCNTP